MPERLPKQRTIRTAPRRFITYGDGSTVTLTTAPPSSSTTGSSATGTSHDRNVGNRNVHDRNIHYRFVYNRIIHRWVSHGDHRQLNSQSSSLETLVAAQTTIFTQALFAELTGGAGFGWNRLRCANAAEQASMAALTHKGRWDLVMAENLLRDDDYRRYWRNQQRHPTMQTGRPVTIQNMPMARCRYDIGCVVHELSDGFKFICKARGFVYEQGFVNNGLWLIGWKFERRNSDLIEQMIQNSGCIIEPDVDPKHNRLSPSVEQFVSNFGQSCTWILGLFERGIASLRTAASGHRGRSSSPVSR